MNKEKAFERLDCYRSYLLRRHSFTSDRVNGSYEEGIMTRAELILFEEVVEAIDFVLNESSS